MTMPKNISEWIDEGDLIDISVDYELGFRRTITPGVITAFDATKQTATVQPVIRTSEQIDEEFINTLPAPVANAPIMYPSGGGFAITWPLSKGDRVVLVVCDRSIEEWSAEGNSDITPQDPRQNDLTDALVYPGTRPAGKPLTFLPAGDALVLGHDSVNGARLKLTSSTVALGTPAVELVSEVDALLTEVIALEAALATFSGALSSATDPIVTGAATALTTALGIIKPKVIGIQTKINTIKGSI